MKKVPRKFGNCLHAYIKSIYLIALLRVIKILAYTYVLRTYECRHVGKNEFLQKNFLLSYSSTASGPPPLSQGRSYNVSGRLTQCFLDCFHHFLATESTFYDGSVGCEEDNLRNAFDVVGI